MPEMADVFRRDGGEYLERCRQDLLPSYRRAMDDLFHGRTEAFGGHLWPCDHCGQAHYVDHSCRNRRGPTCHHLDTEAWLAERRQDLLSVPYVHVVLTLPQELRALVRSNQKDLYDILLRAAAPALITLAADPHDVGGLIGVLGVLHTWTRALVYHPHVHGLVPAGGVSADRSEWRPARQTYLVPVRALSMLFRGRFRDLVRQARPDLAIPASVWTTAWVVSCQPALYGTEQVLRYVGRSVHRIALTHSRMLSIENGPVCFRDQDARHRGWKPMTLPALECIRRLLPHVLPEGFHQGRYYGLGSPVHRPLLHQLQRCLAHLDPTPSPKSPAPATGPDNPWC